MNIDLTDPATASIITAALVGLISIITTLLATSLANRHSFKQLKMQWERENEKAERAERQAERDKEIARQKAIVDKLQEIYGNAIASVSALALLTPELKINVSLQNYTPNLVEVQKHLSLVLAYHYDKQSEEHDTFLKLYRNAFGDRPKSNQLWELRDMIIEFASSDPRLHPELSQGGDDTKMDEQDKQEMKPSIISKMLSKFRRK